jgi:hypothetical protein
MHRHTSLGPEPPFLAPSRLLLLLLLGFSHRVMAFAHDKASQWHPGGPNPIPWRLSLAVSDICESRSWASTST